MRVLFVHPGPLLYTKVFLRLEPLGLEVVAAAARRAGHAVKLIDLQVETHADYHTMITEWRPDLVAFSCNYLANVPEIVDLAKATKAARPYTCICVGGHSASFTAQAILEHGDGAIDCVLKGEGEAAIVKLLEAIEGDRHALARVPGAVTPDGEGPTPTFVHSLDDIRPARDLLRHRHKYFIGLLDPCASIEFSRGCPWDCAFCSAWTFYGRSYRLVNPERAVEELASVAEPGVFIVDDVAFIQDKHGFAIGEAIARKGIRKKYYLETRGDVLLRNKDVFRFWKTIGLKYIFLGLEAIDEDGLRKFRKRVPLGRNFEALELARSLGIKVAINLIADPDWDLERFKTVRDWCMEIPEIVNITVNTPYPGTESWFTEERRLQTRDYRLFDIQHAVLPTRLPLDVFYREVLSIQKVLFRKRIDWRTTLDYARETVECVLRGQTNYLRGMMLFKQTYQVDKLLADHALPLRYALPAPPARAKAAAGRPGLGKQLYVHAPPKRATRNIDAATERFVDETRIGTVEPATQ
jgi:hopanoid C-3 methylase HpnR